MEGYWGFDTRSFSATDGQDMRIIPERPTGPKLCFLLPFLGIHTCKHLLLYASKGRNADSSELENKLWRVTTDVYGIVTWPSGVHVP